MQVKVFPDFCATVNPTIKGFKERVTKRYTVEAFLILIPFAIRALDLYNSEGRRKEAKAEKGKAKRLLKTNRA